MSLMAAPRAVALVPPGTRRPQERKDASCVSFARRKAVSEVQRVSAVIGEVFLRQSAAVSGAGVNLGPRRQVFEQTYRRERYYYTIRRRPSSCERMTSRIFLQNRSVTVNSGLSRQRVSSLGSNDHSAKEGCSLMQGCIDDACARPLARRRFFSAASTAIQEMHRAVRNRKGRAGRPSI